MTISKKDEKIKNLISKKKDKTNWKSRKDFWLNIPFTPQIKTHQGVIQKPIPLHPERGGKGTTEE